MKMKAGQFCLTKKCRMVSHCRLSLFVYFDKYSQTKKLYVLQSNFNAHSWYLSMRNVMYSGFILYYSFPRRMTKPFYVQRRNYLTGIPIWRPLASVMSASGHSVAIPTSLNLRWRRWAVGRLFCHGVYLVASLCTCACLYLLQLLG